MEPQQKFESTTSIPDGSSSNSNPGDLKPSDIPDKNGDLGVYAPPVEGIFGARNVLKRIFVVKDSRSTGDTGNYAIKGVPFSPKGMTVFSIYTDNSAAQCQGSYDGKNQGYVFASTGGSGGGSSKVINLVNSAGTLKFEASAVSFTSDGVILNFATAVDPRCHFVLTFFG